MPEGVLAGGLPYLAFGDGAPVVVCAGLSVDHAIPTGMMRRMEVGPLRRLAARATVYFVNRRPGLEAGTTIADLARDYAVALGERFGEAVPIVGVSTGGSVALQLAADHPEVVRRLMVHGATCRLGTAGREAQRRVAADAAAGRWRLDTHTAARR